MKECEKDKEGKKRLEETGIDEVRSRKGGDMAQVGISLHAPRNPNDISLEPEDVGWPQCAVWSLI